MSFPGEINCFPFLNGVESRHSLTSRQTGYFQDNYEYLDGADSTDAFRAPRFLPGIKVSLERAEGPVDRKPLVQGCKEQ